MDYKHQMKQAADYIETHLCEPIRLAEVARQTFLSPYHFHRIFRTQTGVAVMAYVRSRRLSEAARELKETDTRITDLAFKYQFNSEEAFSRAFKGLFGLSPREYRLTARAAQPVCVQHTAHTSCGSPRMAA